jgi:hypothetical protein
MGKYGQFYGQFLTINIFEKLIRLQLISDAYRATLLPNVALMLHSIYAIFHESQSRRTGI